MQLFTPDVDMDLSTFGKVLFEYVYVVVSYVFTIITFCIKMGDSVPSTIEMKAFVLLFLSGKLLSYPYLKVFSNGKW